MARLTTDASFFALVSLSRIMWVFLAAQLFSPATAFGVMLSNTQLPTDQFNRSLLTGEADILVHPTDGHYYFYFNVSFAI